VDKLGGALSFIAVYGFWFLGGISFFFAPNLLTFFFLCFMCYLSTNFFKRRTNEKEN